MSNVRGMPDCTEACRAWLKLSKSVNERVADSLDATAGDAVYAVAAAMRCAMLGHTDGLRNYDPDTWPGKLAEMRNKARNGALWDLLSYLSGWFDLTDEERATIVEMAGMVDPATYD